MSLTGSTVAEDLASLERCRGSVELAELRADFLAPGEIGAAARLPALAGMPVILAVRRARDGGRFAAGEAERVRLLRRLAAGGFAWVDMEDDLEISAAGIGAPPATGVIRSFHDTRGVPQDLEGRLRGLARRPGELPKAAVTVNGCAELLELLRAAERTRDLPKILVGMGEAGFATRVLAARIGSSLCYASPADGPAAAPGHVDPRVLAGLYRFKSIGASTAVFGVAGNPVGHSLSPVIHNRGFAALGIDAVYVPFRVDELAPFLEAARLLGVRGLSITVPHKEAVLGHLASFDPVVARLGACNTMVAAPGALPRSAMQTNAAPVGWHGTNTDAEGFLAALRPVLPELSGKRAVVIGAGGAARAIVHGLAESGCDVLVANRTPGRARELAERFAARWAPLDPAAIEADRPSLIVQATSAGMASGGVAAATAGAPEDPLPGYRFRGDEVVFDVVYSPRVTPFLARATAAGCTAVPGLRMLIEQARGQFRLFAGREYPRELAEELAATL